jgi:hypothetical protein
MLFGRDGPLCEVQLPFGGILLRRDLHALLDAGKLEIIDGVVAVSSEHYRQFDGVRVW